MNSPNKNRILKGIVLVIAILSCGAFLYFNDPLNSFYTPKCWFKALTGLSCPGCGFQRSLHALLHGNYVSAIKYNLFLTIGIPYLLFVIVSNVYNHNKIYLQTKLASAYIVLFFVWFVFRNIYGL